MTDNDDTMKDMSAIDNFIISMNPTNLNTVKEICSLLNGTTLDETLNDILYTDNVSDNEKYISIITQCKISARLHIKKYGILITTDNNEVPLRWYLQIVSILNKLEHLNGVEYLLLGDVLGTLNDIVEEDYVTMTYELFNIIDHTLSEELFDELVDKVYVEFLNTINEFIVHTLTEINDDFITDDDDDDYVRILTNIFLGIGLNTLPNIINKIDKDNALLPVAIFNNTKMLTTLKKSIAVETDDKQLSSLVMDFFIISLLGNDTIGDVLDRVMSININDDLYTPKDYENEVTVIYNFLLEHNIPNSITTNVYDKYINE